MENDRTHDPAADDARAALDAVDADSARLSERVIGPWWYHVGLGLAVAAIVGAQALEGTMSVVLVALAIIAIPLLVGVYQRHHGVWPAPGTGRATRRLQRTLVMVCGVAFVAALVFRILDAPPWPTLVVAAAAGLAVVALGFAYDRALAAELRAAADRQKGGA